MSSIVTNKFKNLATNNLFEDFTDANNKYYMFIGRVEPWEEVTEGGVLISNETQPPAMTNSYHDQIDTWKRMTAAKRISSSDVTYCIRKKTWDPTGSTAYDEYRDDLYNLGEYYVITDENHVFKCIHTPKDNLGNKLPSTIKPPKETSSFDIRTTDGYVWKYMFTVPTDDLSKFETTSFIPVDNIVDYTAAEETDDTNQIAVHNLLKNNTVDMVPGRVNNVIVTERADDYLMFYYQTQSAITEGSAQFNLSTSSETQADALIAYLNGITPSSGGDRIYNYNGSVVGGYSVHDLKWNDGAVDLYNLYLHYYNTTDDEIYQYPVETIEIQTSGATRTIRFNLLNSLPVGEGIISGATVYVGPKIDILKVSEENKYFFAVPVSYETEVGVDGINTDKVPFGFGKINAFNVVESGAGYYTKYNESGESIISVDLPLVGTNKGSGEIVVSPEVGHGYNALNELNANYIMLTQSFVYNENDTIDISNDFRQVGIWRNPERYDGDTVNVYDVARQTSRLELSTAIPSGLLIDSVVYIKDGQGNAVSWGTVVRKDVASNYLYLTNVHNNAGFENAESTGNVMSYYKNYGSDVEAETGEISTFSDAFLTHRTGQLLYIENRKPVTRAIDQIETVKIVVGI